HECTWNDRKRTAAHSRQECVTPGRGPQGLTSAAGPGTRPVLTARRGPVGRAGGNSPLPSSAPPAHTPTLPCSPSRGRVGARSTVLHQGVEQGPELLVGGAKGRSAAVPIDLQTHRPQIG